jgi:hypothetical protein
MLCHVGRFGRALDEREERFSDMIECGVGEVMWVNCFDGFSESG